MRKEEREAAGCRFLGAFPPRTFLQRSHLSLDVHTWHDPRGGHGKGARGRVGGPGLPALHAVASLVQGSMAWYMDMDMSQCMRAACTWSWACVYKGHWCIMGHLPMCHVVMHASIMHGMDPSMQLMHPRMYLYGIQLPLACPPARPTRMHACKHIIMCNVCLHTILTRMAQCHWITQAPAYIHDYTKW